MKTSMALERLSRNRDPEAWAAILQLHGERIQRVGRYFSADAQMCDDICQETLLQIRDHAGAFRKPDDSVDAETAAEGWIMKIACFTALRLRRQNAARQRRESAAALPVVAAVTSAEDAAAIRETHRCVQEELMRLPQDMSSALTLRYLAGLSDPDIARTLSCSQPTLRKRIQRGLDRLREKLTQRGVAVTTVALGALLKQSFDTALVSEVLPAAWSAVLGSSVKAPALSIGTASAVVGTNSAWVAAACAAVLLLGGGAIAVNRWSEPAHVSAEASPAVVEQKPVRAAVDAYAATRRRLLQLLEREHGLLQGYEKRIAESVEEQKKIDAMLKVVAKERTESKDLSPQRKAELEQQEKKLGAEREVVMARRTVLQHDKFGPRTNMDQIEFAMKEELPLALDGVEAWSAELVSEPDRLFLPVTFEYVDTPFNDAFDTILKRTGLEMQTDMYLDKDPVVNLRVQNMSVLLAIEWLSRLVNKGVSTKYVRTNGKLTIAADHGAVDLRLQPVHLSFVAARYQPEDVQALKQELLAIPDTTRGESIVERNWRLVVNGFPATHKRMADLMTAFQQKHLKFQTNAIAVLASRAEVARLMPFGKNMESGFAQFNDQEAEAFLSQLEKIAKSVCRKQVSSLQGREVSLLSGTQEPRLLAGEMSLCATAKSIYQVSEYNCTLRTVGSGKNPAEVTQTTVQMNGFTTVVFSPAAEDPATNVLCLVLQTLTQYPATDEYCNETAKPILKKKAGALDF